MDQTAVFLQYSLRAIEEDEMLQIYIEMLFGDWKERSANYIIWIFASHKASEFSLEDLCLFTYYSRKHDCELWVFYQM